jgi:hypothetical protein
MHFKPDSGEPPRYMNCLIFHSNHAIRETYAPDIDSDQFPPAQHVRSIHNTPIEGLWHWFVTLFGVDIKDAILEGKSLAYTIPESPSTRISSSVMAHNSKLILKILRQLFNWIWPQILQYQLDKFVEYWNNHKIRYQSTKPNMSGQTP